MPREENKTLTYLIQPLPEIVEPNYHHSYTDESEIGDGGHEINHNLLIDTQGRDIYRVEARFRACARPEEQGIHHRDISASDKGDECEQRTEEDVYI